MAPPPIAREKLDAFGIESLRDRIISGASYMRIAGEIGVSQTALIDWIASDPERSARVREAMSLSAQAFDEMAEAEIRGAMEPFELQKARELASHFRWKASKRNASVYGDKNTTAITGADGGPLQVAVNVSFVTPTPKPDA